MRGGTANTYWPAARAALSEMAALERLGLWQKILFAVSAANLNITMQWRETIYARPADQFYFHWPIDARTLGSLLTFLGLLAVVVYLVIEAVQRLPGPWNRRAMAVLVVALALNPLNSLRELAGISLPGEIWTALVALALLAALVFRPRWLPALLLWAILVSSPLVLLNVTRAVLAMGDGPSAQRSVAIAPAAAKPGHKRIVWLLFDELDNRILREHLSELPNFQAVTRESIVALKAAPPGGSTLTAVPALLLGRAVHASKPVGPKDLSLTFRAGDAPVPFKSADTIFGEITAKGGRVAISGWMFPYCRLFADATAWCTDRLASSMRSHRAKSFDGDVGTWFGSIYPLNGRHNAHIGYRKMISDAREIARGGFDLAYMHLSVPHPPWLWDPKRAGIASTVIEVGYDLATSTTEGYIGNLLHADSLLGEILDRLRSVPGWRDTTLIIQSDHGLRHATDGWPSAFDGPRGELGNPGDVVLIVHLPGQQAGLTIAEEVSSLNTKALIHGIWDGAVSSPQDVRKVLLRPAAKH